MLLRLLMTLVLLGSAALPAVAQTIHGTVRSSDDQRPISGALVVLLGADGARVAGAITDATGAYRMGAPAPGTYRVLTERIGYRTTESQPVELQGEGSLQLDLTAVVEATELEEVVAVADRRRCVVRPEDGVATQRLWDEARKALTATEVARTEGLIRWTAIDYDRDIDPETGKVRREHAARRRGTGEKAYISVPVEDVVAHGFVRIHGDSVTYHTPDAETILSDGFLSTHCFRPVEGEAGMVGLGFEPVRGRRVPDIRGVLWLDPQSSELRSLEYTYTWFPLYVAGLDFGGRVDFERMPTGAWFVRRWQLRLPRVEVYRDLRRGREVATLTHIHETGGEVTEIRGVDGTTIARSRRASVEGIVIDSLRGGGIPGAEVYVSGTSYRTRADEEGRFHLADLPGGEYEISFLHPRLDSIGYIARPRRVRLEPGGTVEMQLGLPSALTLAVEECADRGAGSPLTGIVRDYLTGQPLAGAAVLLTQEGGVLRAKSGGDGRHILCGRSAGEAGVLAAELAGRRGPGVEVTLEDAAAIEQDLAIPLSTAVRLVGQVVDFETGAPLQGAVITVDGTEHRRLSDAAGRFTFDALPPGSHVVTVEHLGYGRHSDSVRVGGSSAMSVEIRVPARAIALEGVVATVTASRLAGAVAGRGFQERRALGFGHFITRDEIERRRPASLGDVLRTVPGVRVSVTRTGLSVSMERAVPSLGTLQTGVPSSDAGPGSVAPAPEDSEACRVQYYVDGVRWGSGIDAIHVLDVQAVEVYRGASEVPGEFGGSTARCGVIVIWTKRGG